MKPHNLAFSDAAVTDILEQFEWYAQQAGPHVAKRWEKGITSTLLQIVNSPGAGAVCQFRVEELAGTRRIGVAGFPKHLVFYRQREREILILRVVHGARDLDSLFSE